MVAKTYDGQTARFLATVATCMPSLSGEVMQNWVDNPKALKKALEALASQTQSPARQKKSAATFNTTVHVDRSIRPAYPDWVKEPLHPELEGAGPTEFDLSKVDEWLHDDQKNGKYVRGQVIYDHLKANDMLEGCFGLADLLAIQKPGIAVFRKHFAGKAVFGWKSVVRDRGGGLFVPYLYGLGGQVKLLWRWLDDDWSGGHPALRFAS